MRDSMLLAVTLATCIGCGASPAASSHEHQEGITVLTTNVSWDVNQQEPQRESYLRQTIVEIAEETFPDNLDQEWIIHAFRHRDHLTFVEVEPKPDTVGYPRFQFVVSFQDASAPKCVATYCLEQGRYSLLCTEPNLKEELPDPL